MEKTNNQPIIADTSGLISLAIDTDHNHKRAVAEATQLINERRVILLPVDVFVETVNVLGKQSSHQTALGTAYELRKPGGQFVWIETTKHMEAALEKFKTQPGAVSMTDCIVMAIADYYNTKDIFGFDKQFKYVGYHRLEPSTDWSK